MKVLAVILVLSISAFAFADNAFENFDNNYEQAGIPDFLPFVGKALPGRCYLTVGSNKKIASVLMISFEEEGFEAIAFDAEKKREDYFDKKTYEGILREFPIMKRMFLSVIETAEGAIIEKTIGSDEYRGEIRESEKYIILRVFINNKIQKYCNYVKKK